MFRLTLDPGHDRDLRRRTAHRQLAAALSLGARRLQGQVASLTLYQGIVIGIAGLLALFLTIVFVVAGALMFPAAAALAWAVFAYVCIDFGFWRKIFGFDDAPNAYGAPASKPTIGATLIVFLFAYLNLRRWHVRFFHIGSSGLC